MNIHGRSKRKNKKKQSKRQQTRGAFVLLNFFVVFLLGWQTWSSMNSVSLSESEGSRARQWRDSSPAFIVSKREPSSVPSLAEISAFLSPSAKASKDTSLSGPSSTLSAQVIKNELIHLDLICSTQAKAPSQGKSKNKNLKRAVSTFNTAPDVPDPQVSEIRVGRSAFQMKLRRCHKNGHIQITNKTNGFEATLFGLNDMEYQTDLIQINKGINEVFISYDGEQGERREFKLIVDSHL